MKTDFNNLGFEIDGLLHLTAKQAFTCLDNGALLVDVREAFEIAVKDFGIAEKILCPFTDFEKEYKILPLDKALIIADCVGLHSKEVAVKLLAKGFTKVANLVGGVAGWERDGLPMNSDVESLSGPCMCQIKSRKTRTNV